MESSENITITEDLNKPVEFYAISIKEAGCFLCMYFGAIPILLALQELGSNKISNWV